MQQQLEEFACRLSISAWQVILLVIVALLIAFGSIFFKVEKVAQTNPVQVLKYE